MCYCIPLSVCIEVGYVCRTFGSLCIGDFVVLQKKEKGITGMSFRVELSLVVFSIYQCVEKEVFSKNLYQGINQTFYAYIVSSLSSMSIRYLKNYVKKLAIQHYITFYNNY